MQRLLPLLLFVALTLSAGASSNARPTEVINDVSYPLYEFPIEARPTKRVNPVYPARARDSNRGGITVVTALVDEKGRVVKAVVKESDAPESVQDAAVAAVRRWRFAPIKENGAAIRFVTLVPIIMRPER